MIPCFCLGERPALSGGLTDAGDGAYDNTQAVASEEFHARRSTACFMG
jgi:hypothetical protein